MRHLAIDDYVQFRFLDDNGNPTNIFRRDARAVRLPTRQDLQLDAGPELGLDLGIPALGLNGVFTPQINVDFSMQLGFGIDVHKGFYLVTANGSMGPEIQIKMTRAAERRAVPRRALGRRRPTASCSSSRCTSTDGVDLDGNGQIDASCLRRLGAVSRRRPRSCRSSTSAARSTSSTRPAGQNHDGILTIPELISARPLDIVRGSTSRAARCCARSATIDFSTLGADFAEHPPEDHDEDPRRLRDQVDSGLAGLDRAAAGRHRRHHARPRLVHLELRRPDPQHGRRHPRPARRG